MGWEEKRTQSSQLARTAAWRKLRGQVLKSDRYRCQIKEVRFPRDRRGISYKG